MGRLPRVRLGVSVFNVGRALLNWAAIYMRGKKRKKNSITVFSRMDNPEKNNTFHLNKKSE